MNTNLKEVRISVRHELHVSVPITDGDVTENEFGSGTFMPTHLVIDYIKFNEEPMETHVELHGHKLKKNGELSQHKGRYAWWSIEDYPEWVTQLVEKYWPVF